MIAVTVSDTVTARSPLRLACAGAASASISYAFALLPDAYQGRALVRTYLRSDQGVFPKSRAAFEMRESL
jgi:hypothetical protein